MSQDGKIQYWKKRFAAQPASGLTKAAYCKKKTRLRSRPLMLGLKKSISSPNLKIHLCHKDF